MSNPKEARPSDGRSLTRKPGKAKGPSLDEWKKKLATPLRGPGQDGARRCLDRFAFIDETPGQRIDG